MDEKTKNTFRWKFYRLAVELNVIILLVAVSILVFFIVPQRLDGIRYPAIVIMLVVAGIVLVDFRKRYGETKAWLHEQPDNTDAERKET